MGPIAAVSSVFAKYFTLRGRARRAEYWWFMLITALVGLGTMTADVLLRHTAQLPDAQLPQVTTLWVLITFIPGLTASIRRLHDTGRPGYFWLLNLIPVIGIVWFVVLMCLPTDHKENAYGPPPFGPRRLTFGTPEKRHSDPIAMPPPRPNAYAGYEALALARQGPTPDMIDARKREVRNLYKTRVLGQKPKTSRG